MDFDQSLLDKYSKQGYLTKKNKDHLTIYCYTFKTVKNKFWNNHTERAKGLIINNKTKMAETVPFKKIFSLKEINRTHPKNLPIDIPEASEKIDGIFGILYWENNKPKIATKSSFSSKQACIANQILEEKYKNAPFQDFKDYTLCFEIVYPDARIVVDYKDTKDLFLTSIINKETGEELSYRDVAKCAQYLGMPHPSFKNIYFPFFIEKVINNEDLKLQEGFVLRYPNGLRIKIKYPIYKKIQKALNQYSTKKIWELLKSGKNLEQELKFIPDKRLWKWHKKEQDKLLNSFSCLEKKAKDFVQSMPKIYTQRGKRLYLKHCCPKEICSIVYAMCNKKDYHTILWKKIKPKKSKRKFFG